MKISIITVVFNGENTIEDCIRSVNSQTYNDIEHIIIDGKSTDNTVTLINGYKSDISIFVSEKDDGIYDAMNKGISMATGDVIGILNCDDLYQDADAISDIMKHFKYDPNLDILYGNLVYVKSNNINKVIRKWKSTTYHKSFFENGNVPPHPSLFLKKKIYLEAGYFDLQFKLAADYEFMLRIFKKYDYTSKYMNRIIVRMRLGGQTNKSLTNIVKQNKEIIKSWKVNNIKLPILLMPLRFIKRIIQFL